jgi:hypothetical protein
VRESYRAGKSHVKSVGQPTSFYLPQNGALCEEAVWFPQNMPLGVQTDMDQIGEPVRKIQAHAGSLAKG